MNVERTRIGQASRGTSSKGTPAAAFVRPPARIGLMLLCAAGCGGAPEGSTRFSEIEEDVFLMQGCIACHPDGTTDLTLQKGRAYSALVGKRVRSPLWDDTPWAGWLLVDPGSPETSALLIAMERPDALPFGLRMPPDGIVPPEDIERVRSWIAAGAHNN